MIYDLQSGPVEIPRDPFDACIAGGGVAGIAIATKLSALGHRVLMVEAGGLQPSRESQDFYRGDNSGIENLPLHETRLRALGGSSNHWGGWCRPFDPDDFGQRKVSPGSAWPIAAADLRQYVDDATAFLGVNRQSGDDMHLNGSERHLRTARMYFSSPPARIGNRFLEPLKRADNILVLLNAPVISASYDSQARAIQSMTIRAPGGPVAISAKHFVLALGTVENVRALLMMNRLYGDNIGNRSKMVGRYYMQHLHQMLGQVALYDDVSAQSELPNVTSSQSFLLSSTELLAQSALGAFRLYTNAIDCRGLSDDLRRVATAAVCSPVKAGGEVFITAEHLPNRESQIVLASETDSLGLPRVRMDWRISDADRRTLREAGLEFGRYLIRAKLGRLKINPAINVGSEPLRDWTRLASAPGAAGHQMGGTRMSRSAADGVVDRDCRVWGTKNLFVAGAAVFRTSSQATPTLTITQFALRLADHLHEALRT